MTKNVRMSLLGAISRTKPPVIDFTGNGWRMWTAYDPTITFGTYFWLSNEGLIHRVTVREDHSLDYAELNQRINPKTLKPF